MRDTFKDGVGFDGSSIRGFQAINESDMLLIPDPDHRRSIPSSPSRPCTILCDIFDPVTRAALHPRSPRCRPARRGLSQVVRHR